MSRRFQALTGTDSAWAPAVDILETGDNLVIRAEVPGVERNAIDVKVEDNTLILSGERLREAETDDTQAYRRERVYGSFVRSFTLPKTVDAARITAEYKNGVLEVTIPKAEEAKPRKIDIKVA
ncbi:MAG: Hsp20 family protein [Acidobacteria bacterium]|nr:Hsp20 family protein [Acidobacteriota bacterium]NIM63773.1 Hsp20 family protein [Acidobacteriota bacterium]NIO59342.1 Hsp20 family protein [Acidobacteriota bacterium]NIQ30356.1 Hsp20 family protein [Acidobacteriota bacterium]NIQ85293.1 Hsp20 family protein [Acidobacteriota bacterium]